MNVREKIVEYLKKKGIERIVIKQRVEMRAVIGGVLSLLLQDAEAEYSLTPEQFAEVVDEDRELGLGVKITFEQTKQKLLEEVSRK